MKFLLAFVCLLSTSMSFSHHHANHKAFEGEGRYQGSNGQSGEYQVHIDGYMFDDHIDLVESYRSNEVESTYNLTIVLEENGFGAIVKNGVKIGFGYCFDIDNKKICHQQYSYKGWNVEKTCKFEAGVLKRIGSVQGGENHEFFKFIDKSTLVHGAEQEKPWEQKDQSQSDCFDCEVNPFSLM